MADRNKLLQRGNDDSSGVKQAAIWREQDGLRDTVVHHSSTLLNVSVHSVWVVGWRKNSICVYSMPGLLLDNLRFISTWTACLTSVTLSENAWSSVAYPSSESVFFLIYTVCKNRNKIAVLNDWNGCGLQASAFPLCGSLVAQLPVSCTFVCTLYHPPFPATPTVHGVVKNKYAQKVLTFCCLVHVWQLLLSVKRCAWSLLWNWQSVHMVS